MMFVVFIFGMFMFNSGTITPHMDDVIVSVRKLAETRTHFKFARLARW